MNKPRPQSQIIKILFFSIFVFCFCSASISAGEVQTKNDANSSQTNIAIPDSLNSQARQTFDKGLPFFVWMEIDKISVPDDGMLMEKCFLFYAQSKDSKSQSSISAVAEIPTLNPETNEQTVYSIAMTPKQAEQFGKEMIVIMLPTGTIKSGGLVSVYLKDGKDYENKTGEPNLVSNKIELRIELENK